MNHIFGPVNSRRLGRSLGVDILEKKICDLDCIYCEVGPTVELTCRRDMYVPVEAILDEMRAFAADPKRLEAIDVVTVTASGEPTLHAGLGEILAGVKKLSGKKTVVLTNGTLLYDQAVCDDLRHADLVIPSLDAVLPASFRKINRPARCLDLERVIEGLIRFSRNYSGELWLEILFVRDRNDSAEDLEALCEILPQIRADRIQLNTVARPPLEKFALPVSREFLLEARQRIVGATGNPHVDLLSFGASADPEPKSGAGAADAAEAESGLVEEILHMLKRRPCTAKDISRTFRTGSPEKVEQLLESLVRAGKLTRTVHADEIYYQ